jgi:hypothetical protein
MAEFYDFTKLYKPTPEEMIYGIPQNTQAWLDARRGRITASDRAHKILYSRESTLNTMMDQMGYELLTPAEDGFSNAATAHGHAFEDQAIGEYDMMRFTDGEIINTPGMFVHPVFDIASATPDFFEGDDTTGQVKCPYKLKNHLDLLHFGCRMVNAKYYTQVQFESFVTGRPRIVFVSYHPDAPATNQLHVEEILRCEKTHETFSQKLTDINYMLVNDLRYDVEKKLEGVDGIPDLF